MTEMHNPPHPGEVLRGGSIFRAKGRPITRRSADDCDAPHPAPAGRR